VVDMFSMMINFYVKDMMQQIVVLHRQRETWTLLLLSRKSALL